MHTSQEFSYVAVFAGEYTDLHSSAMDYPRILREIMRLSHFRQEDLADRLRVSQPTVSRWLKGMQPEVEHHHRIVAEAKRLGILEDERPATQWNLDETLLLPPMVKVKGYVGAGATAHYYAVQQGDLDEVPAPEGSTEATVAVEIKGDSLGLMFDRWLVFYDEVRSPVTPDLIGKLCVVGLADDSILIKKIRNGTRPGRFRLLSEREEPIEDAAVQWAAKVKAMVPR